MHLPVPATNEEKLAELQLTRLSTPYHAHDPWFMDKLIRVMQALQPEEFCISDELHDKLMLTQDEELLEYSLLYDPLQTLLIRAFEDPGEENW